VKLPRWYWWPSDILAAPIKVFNTNNLKMIKDSKPPFGPVCQFFRDVYITAAASFVIPWPWLIMLV